MFVLSIHIQGMANPHARASRVPDPLDIASALSKIPLRIPYAMHILNSMLRNVAQI